MRRGDPNVVIVLAGNKADLAFKREVGREVCRRCQSAHGVVVAVALPPSVYHVSCICVADSLRGGWSRGWAVAFVIVPFLFGLCV